MRCHSTSTSSGSAPTTSGRSALSITTAAISGGSRPCANASPQPVSPVSVCTSTSVAERCVTQPCENANGSASGLLRTWIAMPVIFIAQAYRPARLAQIAPAQLVVQPQPRAEGFELPVRSDNLYGRRIALSESALMPIRIGQCRRACLVETSQLIRRQGPSKRTEVVAQLRFVARTDD